MGYTNCDPGSWVTINATGSAAAMFFGPKITTVFASRWKALGWSAGVLMTAYCSIPSNDEDGANSAAVDPAAAAVSGLIGGEAPAQAQSHVSPWAINTPTPPRTH